MTGLDTDMQEVSETAADATKQQVTFAGTIMSVNPTTVQTDGSGVAIPVKVVDFVSLEVGRRCILQVVGKDVVLTHTYGGNTLASLNVTGDLVTTSTPIALTSAVGSGAISTVSAYAVFSTPASVVFTTPASGRVSIKVKARIHNPAADTGLCYVSSEIRSGSSVGSGSVIAAPSNARAYLVAFPALATSWSGGRSDLHTLTPKTTYNVQAMSLTTNGGGTFSADSITIDVSPEA